MKIRVAQCWDDGPYNDIRLTRLLKKYHAKATFNLCPGTIPEHTKPGEWANVTYTSWTHKGYINGRVGQDQLREVFGDFQVATHNWHHECAGCASDAEFIASAKRTREFLENTFQRECPGFAWPCGRITPETVRLLKEAGFKYGRTTAVTDDVTKYEEPLLLAANCHFQDNGFWQKFQKAKENKVGAFYFWGHSYEMLDSEGMWNQLEQKLAALCADPDVEWVDVIDLVR